MAGPEPDLAAALVSLWTDVDRFTSVCATCGLNIKPDQVLIRTFCLGSQAQSSSWRCEPNDSLWLPELSQRMQFFYRHLECLEDAGSYMAISHVWDRDVAAAQAGRWGEGVSIGVVASRIFNTAARICQGILEGMDRRYEIWHDYISVPQWQGSVKRLIIPSIPRIFRRATSVMVYAADLDMETVISMRNGSTTYERSRAVSDLCGLRWFSRVWTAMEYSQCAALHFMTRTFKCVAPDMLDDKPCGDLFAEMRRRWDIAVAEQGGAQKLKDMVDQGENLVPWQLGPLTVVKRHIAISDRVMFALAHQAFSRRCITNPRDYLSVLIGLTGLDLKESLLDADIPKALQHIAQCCVVAGDMSPLLMRPAGIRVHDPWTSPPFEGYNPLLVFGLGGQRQSAPVGTARQVGDRLMLRAECLGDITNLVQHNADHRLRVQLAVIIEMTIENEGDSVHGFLQSLCRMYGLLVDEMYQRLAEGDRMLELQQHLRALMHADDRLSAVQERLVWLADATGLSNHSLPTRWSSLTPMQYLGAHGSTIHLWADNLLLSVVCRCCRRSFLTRAAAFANMDYCAAMTVWRVPHLSYDFTLPGGCGVLLDGAKIVGRFVWAADTCSCYKTNETEILMNDVEMPLPNEYEYRSSRQHARARAEPALVKRSLTASSCRFDAAMEKGSLPVSC